MSRLSTVVPVLGMHRSGTSLATRALNLMGMDLGWPLQPAGPDNPKGFWEHQPIQNRNRELLTAVGMASTGFGTQPQLRKAAANLSSINPSKVWYDSAIEMLERQFTGPLWGVKDPRLVITWPFWKRLLASNGWTDIRPVVVVRDPSAVLKSLLNRGDFGPLAAATGVSVSTLINECWSTYYSLLFSSLGGSAPPLFLSQEDLLDPTVAAYDLERSCNAIGGDESLVDRALAWIDPRMDHRTSSISAPPELQAAYQRLRGFASRQRSEWMDKRKVRVPVPPELPSPVVVLEGVERPTSRIYGPAVREATRICNEIHSQFGEINQKVSLMSFQGLPGSELPPPGSLVVNLDRVIPGTNDFQQSYIKTLVDYKVFDVRPEQVSTLRRLGITAHELPLYASPVSQLSMVPKTIDVLIFGQISERREVLVKHLKAAGLRVVVKSNSFDSELEILIQSSKLVLTVLYAPWQVPSLVRLTLPISLGTLSLVERGLVQCPDFGISHLADWGWYDELVALAESTIRSGMWQTRADQAFHEYTRAQPRLKQLVSKQFQTALQTTQKSGKSSSHTTFGYSDEQR
jgi:hypothetical protein